MSERLQGVGPYAHDIKKLEDDIKATLKKVNEKMGPWWHGPAYVDARARAADKAYEEALAVAWKTYHEALATADKAAK